MSKFDTKRDIQVPSALTSGAIHGITPDAKAVHNYVEMEGFSTHFSH